MITFLSGGTGTPKLLRGMLDLLEERDIAVIVNTAEDIWLSGNHLSPDVDTVMYLVAGVLNTDRWWGIRDDTYITHDLLARLGIEEFIAVGDRDRAVHVARGEMLRGGMRLTGATKALCERLGVRATVLPMTDSPVTTYVKTRQGEMHFQEYWVKHRGALAIEGVVRRSREPPVATPEVIAAIEASDAVVIGPSNPVTSISPILECAGVREALRRHRRVIAVSPFIGDAPVSGPAAALMRASGREPSSVGTYGLYEDFVDVFIQDIRDPVEIEGALRLDTLMVYRGKSLDLAKSIVTLIYGY
ncbi:2-phospho-L-lactate transferase [Methanoculleus bourgensis]|uniref:2-phospho-L-lactate transferase n=1 Tax=Methanoculleus bourgensis TaxID=83986 RepID=UPI001BDAAFEE|nr:2-phospho-L-lactate transferase [Methanoculleus bourgensis]MBT0732067.1 2-phospho-L-lactate transferase [Methanoculleus bourgensis]